MRNRFTKGSMLHELVHLPFHQIVLRKLRAASEIAGEKYYYGPHNRQYFLFFKPPAGTTLKKTAVVYFHGGGWQFGSPEMFRMKGQILAQLGYPVIMPSYRRIPLFNYIHMREDLNLCTAKAQSVLKQNYKHVQNWAFGGMSAGGNLAAHLVFNQQVLHNLPINQDQISGLYLFSAPLNLDLMEPSPVLRFYAGTRGSELFQQANPYNYITGNEPFPVLCIHSTHDGLVNYDSTRSFVQKLQADKVAFHTIEEGTHLLPGLWPLPDSPLRPLFLDWLERVDGKVF